MSEDKKNNSKEPVDESKVDWSTLGEDWGKLYFGKDETPPELMKRMGSNELLNVLNRMIDEDFKANSGDGIDFAAVRQYVDGFKKTVGCADLLLPGDSAFDEKFCQLSEIVLNEFDIDVLCPMAIIDCGVCNDEASGILISPECIAVLNGGEEDGWVDWPDFKAAGFAAKLDENRVKIYEFDSDSWCTVNVSRCGLSVDDAEKFFDGLLSLICETKKG